jgi:hypothetical protein
MKTGHVPVHFLPPTSALWQPSEKSPPPPRKHLPKLDADAVLSPKASGMGPGCVSAVVGRCTLWNQVDPWPITYSLSNP